MNNMSKPTVKSRCLINNNTYEEVLSYIQILEYLTTDDKDNVWKFKDIIGYQGPLSQTHKDYKKSMYSLTILWENEETSIEPFSLIAANNSMSCDNNTRKNNLINLSRWKKLKGLVNRQSQLFRLISQAKPQNFGSKPKFKYGFEIPRNYKYAIEIDKQNGNTLWQDAIKLELESMALYKVFEDLGHKTAPLLSTKPFKCT